MVAGAALGGGQPTSLLFFGSILFHELSHSVVAHCLQNSRRANHAVCFWRVGRIGNEPASALQEFNIAIAGPLSSLFSRGRFLGTC